MQIFPGIGICFLVLGYLILTAKVSATTGWLLIIGCIFFVTLRERSLLSGNGRKKRAKKYLEAARSNPDQSSQFTANTRPTTPKNFVKPEPFVQTAPVTISDYVEPANQFEQDVRNRIENMVKRHLKGCVLWNKRASYNISLREDFEVKVRTESETLDMVVKMTNDGPVKLSFPNANRPAIGWPKKHTAESPATKKASTPTPKPSASMPTSNAEKKGNTVINKDGKPEVKPNYRMLAIDWINANLDYLNKACNDAMVAGAEVVEALLEESKLPSDKETWESIGAMLMEQEEIDSFKVVSNGIIVTIE